MLTENIIKYGFKGLKWVFYPENKDMSEEEYQINQKAMQLIDLAWQDWDDNNSLSFIDKYLLRKNKPVPSVDYLVNYALNCDELFDYNTKLAMKSPKYL